MKYNGITKKQCPTQQAGHCFLKSIYWFGVKRITEKVRKKVREILLAEVEEYDKYLRGEYFGFVRENNNGEIVDSLFGFTDIKDMLDYLSGEAKQMLLEFVEKTA